MVIIWFLAQKWIRVARRIIRKHNQVKSINLKLTPTNSNDDKQTNTPLRSINHKIVPLILLVDLKKRKSTDVMRLFQPTSNKILPSNTSTLYRHHNNYQSKSIQSSQVKQIRWKYV